MGQRRLQETLNLYLLKKYYNMRKLIILLLFIPGFLFAQKPIENGQRGSVVRASINSNFDTVYTNYLDAVQNVLDYGAVADNSTNNLAAFQVLELVHDFVRVLVHVEEPGIAGLGG